LDWGGPCPGVRPEGRDSSQTKDPRQIYGQRSWRWDETWTGEDPGTSPEGRDSPQTKDPLHIRHGRGVTRTGQMLPI
jgi:hypothetical protein